MNQSVLIIGKPNSGKTTFIAQLYAKLDVNNGAFRLYKSIVNLTPIIDAVNKLSNGDEVAPTPTDRTTGITLPLQFMDKKIDLYCPDYGGEQINNIIENREVDPKWTNSIRQSDNWLIFLRLTNLISAYDLSNKTIPQEVLEEQAGSPEEYVMSDQSGLIELLQIMLATKGHDAHLKNQKTKITIVLTCWDEDMNDELPRQKLQKILPLLLNFIDSNWQAQLINIVGLSALGLSLKNLENRDLYQANGAEKYGFIIRADGTKSDDVTELITEAL
jgi:GTPase SAR1 family protein